MEEGGSPGEVLREERMFLGLTVAEAGQLARCRPEEWAAMEAGTRPVDEVARGRFEKAVGYRRGGAAEVAGQVRSRDCGGAATKADRREIERMARHLRRLDGRSGT